MSYLGMLNTTRKAQNISDVSHLSGRREVAGRWHRRPLLATSAELAYLSILLKDLSVSFTSPSEF